MVARTVRHTGPRAPIPRRRPVARASRAADRQPHKTVTGGCTASTASPRDINFTANGMWQRGWVVLLALWATSSTAQTILLPVEGAYDGDCFGIQAYDLATRSLARDLKQLGCEKAVIALANGHGLSVGYQHEGRIGFAYPYVLKEFNVSTGAVI